MLLLLDDQLPPEWQERLDRFSRIIDVVSTKPEELQASRSRFPARTRPQASSLQHTTAEAETTFFIGDPCPWNAKEPVIDSRAVDLTDRVKLTWRDVRTLADEAAATQPQIRADETACARSAHHRDRHIFRPAHAG